MSIHTLFALADRIQGVDPMHPMAQESYEQSLAQLSGLATFVRRVGSPEMVSCIIAAGHAVKALSGGDPHLDAERVQRGASLLLRVVGDALTHRDDPGGGARRPPAPTIVATERARANPDDPLLGEILIQLGHVTHDQVETALAMHRQKGMAIGECLLLSGACPPERVLEALRLQQRLRSGDPKPAAPSAAPAAAVPVHNGAVPRHKVAVPRHHEGAVPLHDADTPAAPAPAAGRPAAPRVPKAEPAPAPAPPADFHVTTDIFLGEVLLGAEMITKEELEAAMRMHHLKGIRVGEALIALGALSPEDVATGVELQRSLQSIALKTARPAQRT